MNQRLSINLIVLTNLLITVVGLPQGGRFKDSCATLPTDDAPRGNQCVFPFLYKGKTYTTCTADHSDNGKAWCAFNIAPSSEVPSDSLHWADCQSQCPGAGACVQYSEKACMEAANRLGLDIGGLGHDFVGVYSEVGCFSYISGTLKGAVFYGTEGTIQKMKEEVSVAKFRPTGYDCSTEETISGSIGQCKTNGGPSSNATCIFPFIHGGKTYTQCTLDSDGYWCSTKVDYSGKHIGGQGNWGTCSEGCPGLHVEITPKYTCEDPSYVPEKTDFNGYTEYGRHQDCPDSCTEIYDPVCGTNKKPYSNECELKMAACRIKDSTLRVAYKGGCKECSDLLKEKVWNHWSTWTNCKYTSTGYRRRRFSDLLKSIPPSIDTDCLKTTIVDEDKNLNSRRTSILTNYHDVSQYRAAQQEKCKVEDELPDVCTNMQSSELVDWCKSDELYPKCQKTCRDTNPAIRDYGACMNLEYRCCDGFCLDLDQIGNRKPDCIDQEWDQMSGIGNVFLGVDKFGTSIYGDDYFTRKEAFRTIQPITGVPFSNCDRCFGGGTRSREATVLQDQTNADLAGGSDTETISCNEHKQYDSCKEVQGYLDFGQFIPNHMISEENVLQIMDGSEGAFFYDELSIWIRDVKSWNTSKDAMDVCLKDDTCCGVTYSQGLKWTLRNGGSVNKYDGENPISEPTILYGKELDIEKNRLIWGTESLRKDCYLKRGKLSSQFCRDTKPEWCKAISGVPNYEKILCSKSFVITACLKTCGLC